MKLIVIVLIAFVLSGCDRQKTPEEVRKDLAKIQKNYARCISNGYAPRGDIFCKYVLEAPEEMDELLKLGRKEPLKLGDKVLILQQEIGELKKSSNADDIAVLKKKSMQLNRCNLVLKLFSSIK